MPEGVLAEVCVETTVAVRVTELLDTAGLLLVAMLVFVAIVLATLSVKLWVAAVPNPLLAVIVIGKLPDCVGVPLNRPALVSVTPLGRVSVVEKVAAGKPVAVTWKLSAKLRLKVALVALVIAGAWPTRRVRVLLSGLPTPLEAEITKV